MSCIIPILPISIVIALKMLLLERSSNTRFCNIVIDSGIGSMIWLLERSIHSMLLMFEIVVGTPGRLWELMSSGNQHLVEVSM